MYTLRRHPLFLSAFLLCLALAPATRPTYVNPDQFDYQSLIGPPPADDSAEHVAEVNQMLALQASRTPEEVARCQSEVEVTAFAFSSVLGPAFNAHDLPHTAEAMQQLFDNAKIIADVPKNRWQRKRPPLADPRIHPCVKLEKSFSYPSGHATRGIVWATVLGEVFPEDHDALLARGKQIGDDRILAGMHYPSDVLAGQKLGAAIAAKILANPDFTPELNQVKQECHAALHAVH